MSICLDNTLYNKLYQKCRQITPGQCIRAPVEMNACTTRDVEKYDGSRAHELTFFWQMLRLQCKHAHTLIPRIQHVWRHNSVFYIQSPSTSNMKTLADCEIAVTRPMLISMLIDVVSVVRLIHSEGVYHGLLHESAILFDTDRPVRVQLCGFADRDASMDGAFHVQRKRDLDMLKAMFMRLMLRFSIDMTSIVGYMSDPAIDNTCAIITGLRALLIADTTELTQYVCSWQSMLTHYLLCQQTLREIELVDNADKCRTEQALHAFADIFRHKRACLPVFVRKNTVARGRSTWIPLVHEFFDWMTDNKYLVRDAGVTGIVPNYTKMLLTDHIKMVYVFAGYLLAYTFFLDLPLNCAFSKMLVQFVMDSTPVQYGSSHAVYVCSQAEKKIINTIKHHICYMRVGAMQLTSLPIYASFGVYPARLYDHHFNIEHVNVPINALSYDCFDIHYSLTAHERQTVMRWIKSLTGWMADAVTRFVTNSRRVSVVNTVIKLGRSDNDALVVCTCDKQMLLPASWLVSVDVLHTQMKIQLSRGDNDDSEQMDISFNTI